MDKRRRIIIGKNYIIKNTDGNTFVMKTESSIEDKNNITIQGTFVRELNEKEKKITYPKVCNKYVEVYKNTNNKHEFLIECLNKFRGIKKVTILRRYYQLKKEGYEQNNYMENGVPNIKKYLEDEKQKPSHLKMLILKDLKTQNRDISQRLTLIRNGFNALEINWLEEEGYLKTK